MLHSPTLMGIIQNDRLLCKITLLLGIMHNNRGICIIPNNHIPRNIYIKKYIIFNRSCDTTLYKIANAVMTRSQSDFNVLLILSHQANSASQRDLKIIFYKRVIPQTFVSKCTQEVRVDTRLNKNYILGQQKYGCFKVSLEI